MTVSRATPDTAPAATPRMRHWVHRAFGGPEVLQLEEADRPTPGEGEILLRVHAAGVNSVDALTRRGAAPPPGGPPYVPGWDSSGTVEGLGPGVSRFRIGDEVFGMHPGGAYAEYLAAPADSFATKPPGISHVEAAGAPVAALGAWQALVELGQVRPGHRVLVHAAAGGMGHIAVQLAKARGAFVYGTAREPKHAFLRALGVDEPIDYTTDDFVAVARDVDIALDLIGGEYGPRTMATLLPGGLLVSAVVSDPGFGETAAQVAGVRWAPLLATPSGARLSELAALLADGRVQVHVEATLPFEEAAKATALVETERTYGKLVLDLAP
ncbi:NADP-dependent oxidoreductase [Streptomyces candidus]|uniref:NADPH:quinone reductase-like Zn-dependent oxidoreductase n=1 Tax=Streptomyces candidus TaxID=67283 RepID=A0A7X0HIV3_9ACTN|nr:NADP-dependent oxidoreductase [Streptomyces candidus]MBB6438273.1 NADPH:quinone reductase-like Zn-dependent oxidoreductase [Streptomyces candidus]GHH51786.1 NADPH:quinone reductase [Streptomyces candidus]